MTKNDFLDIIKLITSSGVYVPSYNMDRRVEITFTPFIDIKPSARVSGTLEKYWWLLRALEGQNDKVKNKILDIMY